MPNTEHLAHLGPMLSLDVNGWNAWRSKNHDIRPDLSKVKIFKAALAGANLSGTSFYEAELDEAELIQANLQGADLREAKLSRANFYEANLSGANLQGADLRRAHLCPANLSGANLQGADLRRAHLSGADLSGANLSEVNLSEANLSGANLSGANLTGVSLVNADLRDADLTGCSIFGVSAWGLKLSEGTKQQNLVITQHGKPNITVDNIEVAQFIYLLHNGKIRDAIDTITSRAVLILGRFSNERKAVLDALRDELRKRDYLPILFDFEPSASLEVAETIKVLAGLARFVIADITDPTQIRVELDNIVSGFTCLAVQPILLKGQPVYVDFPRLKKFPWVLPIFEYDSQKHLLDSLGTSVIPRAEEKVLKLRREAAQQTLQN